MAELGERLAGMPLRCFLRRSPDRGWTVVAGGDWRLAERRGVVIVVGWIVLAVIAWLVVVAAVLLLLNAAKRADAAAEADWIRAGPGWRASLSTSRRSPSRRRAPARLDRLAREVHRELAVDQVIVVARDGRAPQAVVVVAAAGLPADVLGVSFGPRESVAAAVALTGHAVIAPDHGPLGRRSGEAVGDAAAVPLADPAGAIAIARLGSAPRLTADDLERLRAVVRRHRLAGGDRVAAGGSRAPSTRGGGRFGL